VRRFLAWLVAALIIATAPLAHAAERIIDYDVLVEVNPDASLTVTEKIAVNAEGQEIRRGIYRDIPLRRPTAFGFWDQNGFDLVAVRHNGGETPYHTEWDGPALRIYVGEKDVFIPSGRHTYEFVYRTTRQLRFFEGHDEVYWNVTGNFWTFPILEASARVKLPDGAVGRQVAAYSGPLGSSDQDNIAITGKGTGLVTFRMLRRLGPGEGMTVAVGFDKGFVTESANAALFDWIRGNSGALVFGFSWIAAFAWLAFAWTRVGRDPPGETIIPLFHPPENLSPSALSYVHFDGFKESGQGASLPWIAALLALGVGGLMRIDEEADRKIVFRRGGGTPADPGLIGAGERALQASLFATSDELRLEKANGTRLEAARNSMQSAISAGEGGRFFRRNIGWFVPAVVLAVAGIVGGIALQMPPESGIGALILALMASIGAAVFGHFGFSAITAPSAGIFGRIFGGLLLLIAATVLLLCLSGAMLIAEYPLYRIAAAIIATGVFGLVAMFYLIGAPTSAGASVLPRIKGFKLYLETAEANRLNLRDAPQMSEALYERYLPFAAGLGVEKPWSQAFAAHLARVAPGDSSAYQPRWWHGREPWTAQSISAATSAAVGAVSSAMAASMPQRTSSGSGGSGFSGGGGGGGGGGGW
jgi:uncharacterized membrane protein YgcG